MKRLFVSTAIVAIVSICVYAAVVTSASSAQADSYDLLIRNGRIVDGTGAPWYAATLAFEQGRIAAIGRLKDAQAARTIDAQRLGRRAGLHRHDGADGARRFLDDPAAAINLLTQGITTINAGEGASAAPLGEAEARERGLAHDGASTLRVLEAAGMPINVVQTVGHTQVRRIVLGDGGSPADAGTSWSR